MLLLKPVTVFSSSNLGCMMIVMLRWFQFAPKLYYGLLGQKDLKNALSHILTIKSFRAIPNLFLSILRQKLEDFILTKSEFLKKVAVLSFKKTLKPNDVMIKPKF